MSVNQLTPEATWEDTDAASDATANLSTAEPPTRRKITSRVVINFWLDAALLVTVVFIAWVSAVMFIAFPPPTQADDWTLWGLTFDRWHNLQSTALCVCGLLALEHLVLHWNWVCSTVAARILRSRKRPDEGLQAVYGVGTFITILAIVLASMTAAALCSKPPVP